jgi:4-hydroxy-3-methylbut-2-enyl diphosphate reductase
MSSKTERRRLTVKLASPRGFCAGVERAIRTVEEALAAHGAPVYVRHEIVHNTHVVARLRAMGAVFVDEVADARDDRPLIVSAHGAPRSVFDAAAERNIALIDATCPLVQKVHSGARRQIARGRHVLLIGHAGHPEVEGTMGQSAPGSMTLVETAEEARKVSPPLGPLAYATQTTLAVDETADIIAILEERFPHIDSPRSSDICYATTNRQTAIKRVAPGCDLALVIGSPASSNSLRLVDVALASGARSARLLDDPANFDLASLDDVSTLGITSGASAPEDLVELLLARLAQPFILTIETVETAVESVVFKTPMKMAV